MSRRSSRATKAPEVFNFSERINNKNDLDDDDNNTTNDDDNDDDDDDEVIFAKKKKTSKKDSKKSNKKGKKVSDLMNESDHEDDDNDKMEITNEDVNIKVSKKKATTTQQKAVKKSLNSIYDQISSDTRKMKEGIVAEIDIWISKYRINKIAALVILINFVLISSGAKKNWIDSDIDLDALDADEISELLNPMVASLTKGDDESQYYPLSQRIKGNKVQGHYRERYSLFWSILANTLTDIDAEESGSKDLSILSVIVQQLIQLSSMHLYSLRDAATEAALSIGETILDGMKILSSKSEATNRLLNAESSKSGKNSAKYLAHQKQKRLHDKIYESLSQMKNDIFNSILVHRFKDTNDNIRMMCLVHFGKWLRSDPQTMYKDDNLKYIAWSFFEVNANVRCKAIEEFGNLMESEDHIHLLHNVTARFMERMIAMAVGDTEESVQIEMMKVFRLLQQKGMLDDTINEEQLDKLDKIIFDYTLSLSTRKEALSFFMDHTEGFDVDDEEDEEPAKRTKTSKQFLKADDTKALARKQKIIVQLETFIELAEHLIDDDDYGRVDLLAEACLDHSQCSNVLKDWTSIISLLLRENDGDISTALSEDKVSILLRMLVYSANQLVKQKDDIINRKVSPSKTMRTKGPVTTLTGEVGDAWDSLVENLHKDLPKLFTRFRDDVDNLNILIDLLKCFDDSSSVKALKSTLKLTMDLLDSNLSEESLSKLVFSLKKWSSTNARETTNEAISSFHTQLWNKILKSIEEMKNLTSSSSSSSKSKGKKGRASSSDNSQQEFEETMYGLSSSMMKYKIMWKNFDCTTFIDQNLDQQADELVEVIDVMISQIENPDVENLKETFVACAKDAADTIFAMLLWPTKIVYTEAKKLSASDVDIDYNTNSILEENINLILTTREKLVDSLLTWMKAGHTGGSQTSQSSSSSSSVLEHSYLKKHAFKMICDLRNVFPLGNKTCNIVDQLAFTQTADDMGWMKSVFEHEGAHYKTDISNNYDENGDPARGLVDTLINPLIKSIVFDINNLNKRQAASVISYLSVENPLVQKAVINMMNALLKGNTFKALEVQLVALKDYYTDNIQSLLRIRDEENENYDYDQNDEEIEEHTKKLDEIALKLSATLGKNKVTGSTLKGLEIFFKSCVEFALKDVYNLGFVSFLRHYHKLLPVKTATNIAIHMDAIFEANEELVDVMKKNDTTVDVNRFYEFRSLMRGSAGKSRRTSSSSSYSPLKVVKKVNKKISNKKKNELHSVLEDDDDDEDDNNNKGIYDDDDDDDYKVTGKRGRGQSKAKTTTKTKSQRYDEDDDNNNNDDDDDNFKQENKKLFNNNKPQQYGKKRSSSSSSSSSTKFGLVLEKVESDNDDDDDNNDDDDDDDNNDNIISSKQKMKTSSSSSSSLLLSRNKKGSNKTSSQKSKMDDSDDDDDDENKDIFAELVNVPIRNRNRR